MHRDIKPSNFLLWNGKWVLGDIGLMTYRDDPAVARFAGTPDYAPTERRNDTPSCDLFGLGMTLRFALHGNLNDGKRILPPSDRTPVVERLYRCIRRATSPDRGHRYRTASEMRSDLGSPSVESGAM